MAAKALVVIAAQLDASRLGRVRLRQAPDASARSLEYAIEQAIEPGSKVRTDGWKGYNRSNRLGYIHEVVHEEADVGDNVLPSCFRTSGLLRRWLLGTDQGAISGEHLDYYLNEFTFRFNRRTSRHRGKLFYRLLQQAMAVEAVPLIPLAKHARGRKPQHNI